MVLVLNARERGTTELGGQINMVREVPGKLKFKEMLWCLKTCLYLQAMGLRLAKEARTIDLVAVSFDEIVIITRVRHLWMDISGIYNLKMLSRGKLLNYGKEVGCRLTIIGADAIGFNVVELLLSYIASHVQPKRNSYML